MKNKHGPVFHILNLWISSALCFIFWTCKLCYKESAGPCVSYLELVNFATKNKHCLHVFIFIGFCFAASLTFQLCFAAKQKQFVLLLCSKLWTLLDQFVKWKDHACILHDLWTITRNEQNHSPIFHILCWWSELQSMNRAKLLNFMLWVENMGKYALIFRVSFSKTRVP